MHYRPNTLKIATPFVGWPAARWAGWSWRWLRPAQRKAAFYGVVEAAQHAGTGPKTMHLMQGSPAPSSPGQSRQKATLYRTSAQRRSFYAKIIFI